MPIQKVCTLCGAIGRPVRKAKGSFIVEVVLWLLFLFPGLIYSLWRLTSKYDACPSCGQPSTMIPVDSPNAQRLLQK
jgi:hypothetical protein